MPSLTDGCRLIGDMRLGNGDVRAGIPQAIAINADPCAERRWEGVPPDLLALTFRFRLEPPGAPGDFELRLEAEASDRLAWRGSVTFPETVGMTGADGDTIKAYLARPLGPGPFPAVVLIHHIPGWDEFYREATRKFLRRASGRSGSRSARPLTTRTCHSTCSATSRSMRPLGYRSNRSRSR